MLTPEKIAELYRLAKDATPGPWEECRAQDGCGIVWSVRLDMPTATTNTDSEADGIKSTAERKLRDARFIAAADPQTVTELIDEITRLRMEVDSLESGFEVAVLKTNLEETTKELDKVRKENDELRAQVTILKRALDTAAKMCPDDFRATLMTV